MMRRILQRVPRLWAAPIVVAIAVGLAGAAVAGTRSRVYRADVKLVVAPGSRLEPTQLGLLTRTLASLVPTRALATNVVSSLQNHEEPESFVRKIHVRVPSGTASIVISVDGATKAKAERAAQQVAIVFASIARAKLGEVAGGPAAVVWDSPTGSARQVAPRPLHVGVLSGAVALLAGIAALWQLGRAMPARPRHPIAREPRARVQPVPAPSSVTQPWSHDSADEASVEESAAVPTAAARSRRSEEPPPARAAPLPAASLPEPVAAGKDPGDEESDETVAEGLRSEPEDGPRKPSAASAGADPPARAGRWQLAELELLVASAAPFRRAELNAYVAQLRSYADATETLPSEFDSLVREVFCLS